MDTARQPVERGARLAGPWPRDDDEASGIVSFAGARPAGRPAELRAASEAVRDIEPDAAWMVDV